VKRCPSPRAAETRISPETRFCCCCHCLETLGGGGGDAAAAAAAAAGYLTEKGWTLVHACVCVGGRS